MSEALKPITVNTSPAEHPHIYAEDDASFYAGIAGYNCVFKVGESLAARAEDNNTVSFSDGVFCVAGHIARILPGMTERVKLYNGPRGNIYRNDTIVARFETTGAQGSDQITIAVKKGPENSVQYKDVITTPLDSDNVYLGAGAVEFPLYIVKFSGINIEKIVPCFDPVDSLANTNEDLSEYIKPGGAWNLIRCIAERTGKIVNISFTVKVANRFTPGNSYICLENTLPKELRPKSGQVIFTGIQTNGSMTTGKAVPMAVESSGNIRVYTLEGDSNIYFHGNVTYAVI